MNAKEKADLIRFVMQTRDAVVGIVQSRFDAILARLADDKLPDLNAALAVVHGEDSAPPTGPVS